MKNENNELPSEGFVRLPAIIKSMGICESSWWKGVKEGRYPKSIKLGAKTTVWRVEDIRELIAKIGAQVEE